MCPISRCGWIFEEQEETLILEVWDCSPEPPAAQDPDFMDEGGSGLHVVDELSIRWNYDIFCCGKVTWALLDDGNE